MYISSLIGEKNTKRIKIIMKDIKHFLSRAEEIKTKYEYRCVQYKKRSTFFGYYDLSPFCPFDENLITYVSIDEDSRIANVHIHNIKSDDVETISQTNAWNWQQACRLRWVPNRSGSKKIMFNSFDSNKYVSKIINIDTGYTEIKPTAFYDIDNTGTIGISTDFARLGVLRPGYGYTCHQYDPQSVRLYDNCIEVWNLENDNVIDTLTYQHVLCALGVKEEALHMHNCYVNHLCFSPSGEKFLFFFVEIINGFHHAKMLTYNIKTKIIEPVEVNMKVSHYMWANDNIIIATCYDKQYQCRYYKYYLDKHTRSEIMKDILVRDGHPIFIDANKWISDTYPDENCYQKLFFIYPDSERTETILDVFSTPHCYGEKRTDLHPRINAKHSLVCIDANNTGKRCLILINIKK